MFAPVLESPDAQIHRLIADNRGNLKTMRAYEHVPSRVILESPGGILFELRVTNRGDIVIHCPPKHCPPSVERVTLANPRGCEYEIFISDRGVLHLEVITYHGLEPLRLWYASGNLKSGLIDVEASVYLGSSLIASELRLSEIGSSGVYSLFYTPTIEGFYMFKISSDTLSSLAIIKRNVTEIKFANLMADLYNKNAKINPTL